MKAEQMRYEFEVGYDKITNFDAPGYEPKEISTFLTRAQEAIVYEVLEESANDERNRKILSRLRKVVTKNSFVPGNYPNSFLVDVVTDTGDDSILRVRNERADITIGTGNFYNGKLTEIEDVKVFPIDDDYYHANKDNPFKKPDEGLVWRIEYSNETGEVKQHEYITDGTYTLTNVHLHVDMKPVAIIVPDDTYDASDGEIDGLLFSDYVDGNDCKLDSIVHREIVDRAVKLAYAALQDQTGFQISSVQEQQT